MRSCTARAMSLAAILAGLGALESRPAYASTTANTSPQHEKFLQLLISRQDNAILQHLQTQKRSLDIRLHRLEHEFSKCYKLEAQFRGAESRTRRRDELVTKLIANPPRSPTYNQLLKIQKGLTIQQQRLNARISYLNQVQPTSPRQAAQVSRALNRLSRRTARISNQIAFIDRATATPYAPAVAATFSVGASPLLVVAHREHRRGGSSAVNFSRQAAPSHVPTRAPSHIPAHIKVEPTSKPAVAFPHHHRG